MSIKVVSLFDGISCARQALHNLGIPVSAYYASEIDKYAMQISANRWPEIIQLGGVHVVNTPMLLTKDIDLLIGGSPCQDLSIAKSNRKGLGGERSGLFYEYVRILKEIQPKYFVLENVASMPKADRDIITAELGVEPIMINASLVSAQNRKRLFWTNIPNVVEPNDRGIELKDVLETDFNEVQQYRRTYYRKNVSGKSPTLTANMGTGGNNVPYIRPKSKTIRVGGTGSPPDSKQNWDAILIDGEYWRRYTVIECERLQSLPDNYTDGVSKTQRLKAIGNGFNVDVIAHILSFVPEWRRGRDQI